MAVKAACAEIIGTTAEENNNAITDTGNAKQIFTATTLQLFKIPGSIRVRCRRRCRSFSLLAKLWNVCKVESKTYSEDLDNENFAYFNK